MVKQKEILNKKIYCSLDIETTGFDPLKEEVLEVGFAFFEVSDKGIRITEEWTRVFKPSKEVSAQILGLTGISKEELENAPSFSEHRDYIQDKLGNAIIVGHNIAFDIKFLEGFGIKFSGQSIDTLDLVQWILPTHHSYNLENLMHTFGISHAEAHRALADSKATLKLLEKLLMVFFSFPETLQAKLKKLISKNSFLWEEFFNYNLKPLSKESVKALATKKREAIKGQKGIVFKKNVFYNFPIDKDCVFEAAQIVHGKKALIVTPKAQIALDLFKKGLVDDAVFLPEQQFDAKKFALLLKREDLSQEEIRFLLKVLVWKETNWQTKTILDLNLSFFGGQFKTLVSGGKILEPKSSKSVVCDMAAFLEISEDKQFKNYQVVICGLSEFEAAITSGIGTKVSWGYLNFLLKSYYNPEIESGNEKFKSSVEAGLLASDMFFGLVNALLKPDDQAFMYVKVNSSLDNLENWQKIKAASESFIEKLSAISKELESGELEKFTENVKDFFAFEENRVKWLELAESRCVLSSMPLDISSLVKDVLSKFEQISFVDCLDKQVLPEFFIKRLGLTDYKYEEMAKNSNTSTQGDLFSGLKKLLGKSGILFNYREHAATDLEIREILKKEKPWPAVVLFASPVQVKEFYEKYYEELKLEAALFAQTAYGGSNKILRNFSINKNSLMLVADKLILKSLSGTSPVESVVKLEAKTLVICRLPFEQFTHPYQEAVSAMYPNSFEDYALPKALYNLHCLIKLFNTPTLKSVYIIDAKLSKPYAKVFKDYWQNIKGATKVD